MKLLWYNESAKKPEDRWQEEDFDIDMTAAGDSLFHTSPFALGTYGMDRIGAPWYPGKNIGDDQDPKRDSTSLRIGERLVLNPLWQYNYFADPRTAGSAGGGTKKGGVSATADAFGTGYGRVYNERIRGNTLMCYIQPGQPKFFGITGFFGNNIFSGEQADMEAYRKAVLEGALSENAIDGSPWNSLTDTLADLLDLTTKQDNPTKFYDFKPDFLRWRTFTKSILAELAIRMGLADLYKYDGWFGLTSRTDILTAFMDVYGMGQAMADSGTPNRPGFIPLRIEKSTSVNDSFSNSTGESSFAGLVKGATDQVKEIQFLAGGNNTTAEKGGAMNFLTQAVNSIAAETAGAISNNAEAVIKTGGNMLFPEVWKDSTYSKSVTINVKLHAPAGNKRCIYESVLFPLSCILSLAMPRAAGAGVYTSPPLVRCYSKGWFGIDMGMIESLSITRGQDKNDWTSERLPRTVDVSINIKDLWGSMMMSIGQPAVNKFRIFHKYNSAFRDYLNVLGGLDAFSEASFSKSVQNKWNALVAACKEFVDPRATFRSLYNSAPARVIGRIAGNFFSG
jgi:hypothetical protein